MIAGYNDVKMKADETHWNICTDIERQQGENMARPRLYQRDRVVGREWDGKKRWRRCKMWRCNTDVFTHRRSAFLHTEAFTYTDFFTQKFFTDAFFTISIHFRTNTFENRHGDAFTHRHLYAHRWAYARKPLQTDRFYTQKLLHRDSFTYRRVYPQTLLHTGALTQRRFYTQTLLHRPLYSQTFLPTNASTHRRFYTKRFLHTNVFTHRLLYKHTHTLLHTGAITHSTHRHFYTQALLHTLLHTNAFTHRLTPLLIHRRFYSQTL